MPAPIKLTSKKKLSPGRPCLLTKQREAALLKGIEDGLPLKHAAMLAGISYDTLNRWRKCGEPEYAPIEFRNFCKALRRSEAVAVQNLVKLVHGAGTTDWRAASWMLERRFPEEFGKPVQVEHSGPGGSPIQTHATVEPEVLRRMRKQEGMQELVGKLGAILLEQKAAKKAAEAYRARSKGTARLRE